MDMLKKTQQPMLRVTMPAEGLYSCFSCLRSKHVYPNRKVATEGISNISLEDVSYISSV